MRRHKYLKIIASLVVALFALAAIGIQIFRVNSGKIVTPQLKKVENGIYGYSEGMNASNMYLVIGGKRAVMIDTGNGLSKLDKSVKEVTDKPVFVINTHGHFDHTGGNRFFDEAWVPKLDETLFHENNKAEVIRSYYSSDGFFGYLAKYFVDAVVKQKRPDTANYYAVGKTFDLGGRSLSTINLGGHTAGSTGLIDSKTGILFSGDAIIPTDSGLLMNLDESITIAEYKKNLQNLKTLVKQGKVKGIFSGHAKIKKLDVSIIDDFIKICEKIENNDLTAKERKNHKAGYNGYYIQYWDNKIK